MLFCEIIKYVIGKTAFISISIYISIDSAIYIHKYVGYCHDHALKIFPKPFALLDKLVISFFVIIILSQFY